MDKLGFARIKQLIVMGLFMIIPFAVCAEGPDIGLGVVANNLMDPVSVFSGFISSGCFIIGASFLFASIVKYKEHKRSPLMVPISTVIFLLIAGIVLILLPFASYVADTSVPYAVFH